MVISCYRESFSKFYRKLGTDIENMEKIDRNNRKWKQFESISTISENYTFNRYFNVGNEFDNFLEKYQI
jgi:hypothetical protein